MPGDLPFYGREGNAVIVGDTLFAAVPDEDGYHMKGRRHSTHCMQLAVVPLPRVEDLDGKGGRP